MGTQQGKLIAIAARTKSRAPMVEVSDAQITPDEGVVGDFRGKPGRRQVTVLAVEDWKAACDKLGKSMPWTTRRANLLVEGVSLCDSTHARICIGDVVLQVTGETEPCGRMDEVAPGLRDALTPDWRGGVCCQVIRGGSVSPETSLRLERAAS